jgi:hypothetical protein
MTLIGGVNFKIETVLGIPQNTIAADEKTSKSG